jgi:hypothetical protein
VLFWAKRNKYHNGSPNSSKGDPMQTKPIPISTRFITLAGLSCLLLIFSLPARSQTNPAFDLAAYKQFLSAHQDMSSDQLRSLYPAGTFASKAVTNFADAIYSDSIRIKYDLTDYEKSLIQTNGFIVTERLKSSSFGNAFLDIYQKDLPLFISTDAILHALHMSYDAMLRTIEERFLIGKLDSVLARLHAQVPILANRYASIPNMKQCLQDVDLYLTVPRKLLGDPIDCKFPENSGDVTNLLNLIKAEQASSYSLFSGQPRDIDFSQFTIRGHYTQTPPLGRYFQSMMWLGRIEIYLIAPTHVDPPVADSNVQRQTIDAALLVEAAQASGSFEMLEEMDRIVRYLVGESDNVSLPNMRSLMTMTSTDSANKLLNVQRWKAFQDTLKGEAFAFQRILSQMLYSDPFDPESIQPASSLLLLGQRFIIDSYVTGNVVYDRIPNKRWRGLPSSFDVLFSLGNDGAAQLLESELSRYKYATNLAALRFLVDSYEPEFWNSSLYNGWLNSIRALNPPPDRSTFPDFMRTAAWWQEKMNTQLASWAQLRHDNLLYAKQSYTGGTICSYPFVYVEPIPGFYRALSEMAAKTSASFDTVLPSMSGFKSPIIEYWDELKGIADTLGFVAQKELSNTSLTAVESAFLQRVFYTSGYPGCGGPPYVGWYYDLYFTGEEGFRKADLVVADIHTCPTDEAGDLVGWVLHVGTGPVNLAVVDAKMPDGRTAAFVGPVMSYYEHVSTNFKRLTDEEWATSYQISPSFRPDFVNLYLADSTGNVRPGVAPSLVTSIGRTDNTPVIPSTITLGRNFPNPFNSSTIITFSIPPVLASSHVELWVHNVLGQRVKQLLNQEMPSGKYATKWDGTVENGDAAASGVYFYSLRVDSHILTGKMSYVK